MSIFSLPKKYFKVLFYIMAVIVFFVAILPNNIVLFDTLYDDKIKHIIAFFSLSLLLNRASSTMTHRLRNMSALLLFGIFIEIAQLLFPNRTSSIADIMADLIGILLFQLFYMTLKFFKKNK